MPASDPIALLLAGQYPDPETGALLACESRAVAIEDTLDGAEVELVASIGDFPRLALIADVDTHAALGARVERALASRHRVQAIVLGRRPHCDVETVARVAALIEPCDAIVAVGSGTINDLCKMVALGRGCPQLVFATAPSMNGYTSVSASITEGGFKRSVRARSPLGVFLDLGVLAAAPIGMIRAGLGDSVCRPTAQADWLLAHLLLDQPYRTLPFELLAPEEPRLFGEARALVHGDRATMRALARTLVLSGFGMTMCGGSFPASQGEHLISHYLEMMRPPEVTEALHGTQVGVAAIFVAWVQQSMLECDTVVVHAPVVSREEILQRYGRDRGEVLWRDFSAKQVDPAILNARLAERWPAIRARIAAIASTPSAIATILDAAGAPTTPATLGYPNALFEAAMFHAHELRDRYTFLDLAANSG